MKRPPFHPINLRRLILGLLAIITCNLRADISFPLTDSAGKPVGKTAWGEVAYLMTPATASGGNKITLKVTNDAQTVEIPDKMLLVERDTVKFEATMQPLSGWTVKSVKFIGENETGTIQADKSKATFTVDFKKNSRQAMLQTLLIGAVFEKNEDDPASSAPRKEYVSAYVALADLDIDTDNNTYTRRTHAEDLKESTTLGGSEIGKLIIYSPFEDADSDGILDSVDFNGITLQPPATPVAFPGMSLFLNGMPAATKIRFSYNGSDPDNLTEVTTNGVKTYEPAPGNLRLWTRNADAVRSPKDILANGPYVTPNTVYTLDQLNQYARNKFDVGKDYLIFYIEALRPSIQTADQSIEVQIQTPGTETWTTIDKASATLVPAALLVDMDRNGEIDQKDAKLISTKSPFGFRPNDDDNNLGATPEKDYINSTVDGVSDLLDFFPVCLDIKQLVDVLPPSETVKYILKCPNEELNVVFTNLTAATAFSYRNSQSSSSFGPELQQSAAQATTQQVTAEGLPLPSAFLTNIKNNNQGVILAEGRKISDQPLTLEIKKDNVIVAQIALKLLGARFEPRSGMIQKGWDAYLEKGTPWTSVVAGKQGQVAAFEVANPANTALIGFEVSSVGREYIQNVDAQGRLLTAPGGALFTLGATHTDIPIYATPQTGLKRYEATIIAKTKTSSGQLTNPIASLKVSILVQRQLRIHLFKVIDTNSSGTAFSKMPTMSDLLLTLNNIYAQAGVQFIAGTYTTLGSSELGLSYDTNSNGCLDLSTESQIDEVTPLRAALDKYLEGGERYSQTELSQDVFAFVFKESRIPTSDTIASSNQPYYQRGGNLEYGPFVASNGFSNVEEIANAIGHEIGHNMFNLPFPETVIIPDLDKPSVFDKLIKGDLKPDVDDAAPNTTKGHDNFRFIAVNSGTETHFISSLMRSGIYKGIVTQPDQYSRSLRKLFWEEANARAFEKSTH